MSNAHPDHRVTLNGETVEAGSERDLHLKVSETYSGDEVSIPIRVMVADEPGPKLLVTAAIHGDEINGTGIIHDFLFQRNLRLRRGALILIPVVNIFGFESNQRYMPDRRDLNRSFPGSPGGSLSSRFAHQLTAEIVSQCDCCVDLHSAASQRTNFPNVRVDFTNRFAKRLALAFGCALIVDGRGPEGSLRYEATRAGCPTILLEAGEPLKIEPSVLEVGVRGINNVLKSLEMIEGRLVTPPFQAMIRKSIWLRASTGGLLRFHIGPGDFIEAGQQIATVYNLMGTEGSGIFSQDEGIALSIATMPAVKPGEPVCHVGYPTRRIATLRRTLDRAKRGLHRRARRDLATNVAVTEPFEDNNGTAAER